MRHGCGVGIVKRGEYGGEFACGGSEFHDGSFLYVVANPNSYNIPHSTHNTPPENRPQYQTQNHLVNAEHYAA